MKFFSLLFALAILAFMAFQIYNLNDQRVDLIGKLFELDKENITLSVENQELQADLKYFGDDFNLSKELRSKFNYKYPSEELLILVPEGAE